MDWYVKLIRTVFPTTSVGLTIRSLSIMVFLLVCALWLCVTVFDPDILRRIAVWFTAGGIVLVAGADASAIGTVRLKSENAEPAADRSSGNPAGTWLRLIGHGLLIPGALILLFTL